MGTQLFSLNGFSQWGTEAASKKLSLHDYVLEYEKQEHGLSEGEVREKLSQAYEVMDEAIQEGLEKDLKSRSGMIAGGGKKVMKSPISVLSSEFQELVAYALAAKEVNACMGKVVAAPTAGASGILPATLKILHKIHGCTPKQIIDAMLVAAGIGIIIEKRASIAGSVGGCQAETGSAAAMGSGAITYILGQKNTEQVFRAVAITIQCMLGLVCDPVAGLVEVPCVVRNASASAIAYSSAQIALSGIDSVIPADECVDAMGEIGLSMETRYKETAEGGLAATPTGKDIMQKIIRNLSEEKNGNG
ncbi:MAG: L-serine ammonia-lyase, iron-sulfur-dependent, subunit alpha [Cytophagales bacterium]|nr:L-serine ammonia-lyase, iron-sulfur-dependent, subunit alpha [Cytophagales bacterium]